MSAQHPFQKLAFVRKEISGPRNSAHFFAAAGPYIYTLDLFQGQVLSRWPATKPKERKSTRTKEGQPPEKRRRLSDGGEQIQSESEESSTSVEIKTEKVKGQRRRPKPEPGLPNVSHLMAVPHSRFVAITAEDKCVRVLSVDDGGALRQLSERVLSKRPCAIALSPSKTDIIIGDKFGDVYSLPLEPSAEPQPSQTAKAQSYSGPSASEYTVHTKGNLAALKQQRNRQEKQSAPSAKRDDKPNFASTLLLGHVSLLTALDVTTIETAVGSSNALPQTSRSRSYILTSDRDEHIRISRLPQSHIIESYCYGHTSFVTSLTIPPWASNIIVSGSGVPELRTHQIPSGRGLSQISLRSGPDASKYPDVSISGLWSYVFTAPFHEMLNKPMFPQGLVLVALEGYPILYPLTVVPNTGAMNPHAPIDFPGNVLDIALVQGPEGTGVPLLVVVSLDTAHEPGSFREAFDEKRPPVPFLEILEVTAQGMKAATPGFSEEPATVGGEVCFRKLPLLEKLNETLHESGTFDVDVKPSDAKDGKSVYSTLGEFLYGRENLRKKSFKEMKREENEEENGAAEAVEDEVVESRGS